MVCMFGVCCQTLDGANVVREARKTIKNARYEENGDEAKKVRERLDAAEKSLMDALSGEKKVVKRAELYYTAALVQCRLNDIENEKIYLKRAYDTVLYYNSIYNAYKYFEKCVPWSWLQTTKGVLSSVRRLVRDCWNIVPIY